MEVERDGGAGHQRAAGRPWRPATRSEDKADSGFKGVNYGRWSTWTTRTTGWCGRSARTGSARRPCACSRPGLRELAPASTWTGCAGLGGECDFASEIAVHYPLYVILSLLGLPESVYPPVLQLTRELFGAQDAEMSRGEGRHPDERAGGLLHLLPEHDRGAARPSHRRPRLRDRERRRGRQGPLGLRDRSYYVIIATAGHDTTSSTIAGGLHALIEHPAELERLRSDPALLDDRRGRDDPVGYPGQGIHAYRHRRHLGRRGPGRRR